MQASAGRTGTWHAGESPFQSDKLCLSRCYLHRPNRYRCCNVTTHNKPHNNDLWSATMQSTTAAPPRNDKDDDGSELNFSFALSRIIGEQKIDFYKAILKSEHAENQKMLEVKLEQALVACLTSLTDIATSNLVAERAAMQMRLDQVTSVSRLRLEAGLAAGEQALKRAETTIAAEHREELMQVVAAQCRAFREHDAI